jgi:Xaa-Pro aminopeptidase
MVSSFFVQNRLSLAALVGGGIIVVPAYSEMQRGNDAAFMFEQEANFWWLTGIEAPDWWLIIDGQRNKSWLVSPSISDTHAIFDGSLSSEAARVISGVDYVIGHDEAVRMLRDLSKKHSVVYSLDEPSHSDYYDFASNPAIKKNWRMLQTIFNDAEDVRPILDKLRAIKQPEEIMAIKKAIKLTVDAFKVVKQKLPDFRYEYEVEAEFSYFFRRSGAEGHAYDPIVAVGANACTLHYGANKARLKKGSILLLDIGARLNGYAADISRSYAVGAQSSRHSEVHQAVADAQCKIIKLLRPNLNFTDYNNQVDQIMKQALISLGLIEHDADESQYRKYFPHAIGHGLGVDVHDSLGHHSELLPGMILTVEPGIYIPEEGIGVRIEDDILITDKGHTNLSSALPTAML